MSLPSGKRGTESFLSFFFFLLLGISAENHIVIFLIQIQRSLLYINHVWQSENILRSYEIYYSVSLAGGRRAMLARISES